MTAYTEPVADAATLARGRLHVLAGVAVVAAPLLTLLALGMAGHVALFGRPLSSWVVPGVLFAVALLAGSVVARWIAFAVTCMLSMLALPMLALGLASGHGGWTVLGAVLLVMLLGLALTWVTRPARAWHAERDRRRAERRAHRTRRLAEWRAASGSGR